MNTPHYPADIDLAEPRPPRLWRSSSNRMVSGVLGGLAEKFGLDAQPMRILYGMFTIASAGLLAIPYIWLWSTTRVHGVKPVRPRLWRSKSDKLVAGVLGGMAEKFGTNSTFLRILYAMLSVFSAGFPGILIYLVLWMFTRPLEDTATQRSDY